MIFFIGVLTHVDTNNNNIDNNDTNKRKLVYRSCQPGVLSLQSFKGLLG